MRIVCGTLWAIGIGLFVVAIIMCFTNKKSDD